MILSRLKGKISAVSLLEAGLVLSTEEFPDVTRLLEDLGITVEPFNASMTSAAIQASWRYGKGRSSSKAKLNFGDCCAYATAQILDLPLLFKGDNFTHTGVKRVDEANFAP